MGADPKVRTAVESGYLGYVIHLSVTGSAASISNRPHQLDLRIPCARQHAAADPRWRFSHAWNQT
jgi:hypothetical protein